MSSDESDSVGLHPAAGDTTLPVSRRALRRPSRKSWSTAPTRTAICSWSCVATSVVTAPSASADPTGTSSSTRVASVSSRCLGPRKDEGRDRGAKSSLTEAYRSRVGTKQKAAEGKRCQRGQKPHKQAKLLDASGKTCMYSSKLITGEGQRLLRPLVSSHS